MGFKKELEILYEKRRKLSAQIKQWYFKAKSISCTCGGCNKELPLSHLYRCLYCGLMFCRQCAEFHFGEGFYRETLIDDKLEYVVLQKRDGLCYPEVVHIEKITLEKIMTENENLKITLKKANLCERCKKELATTTYAGTPVCEHCCKMLDDEFDREMS